MKLQLLKSKIKNSLQEQGFHFKGDTILPHSDLAKSDIRSLNTTAVQHKIDRSRPGLERHENRLLGRFASGHALDPTAVNPTLVPIESGSDNELLFRYAALHWSIPVSSGYGRRLR